MPETWVVNASPIIVLAKVDRVELLTRQSSHLILPEPVAAEILRGPASDPARLLVESGSLGAPKPVKITDDVLEWGLGAGESAVISAARQSEARAVLDDAEARACARTLRVAIIGTLGVVMRARLQHLITDVGSVIRDLRNAGLFIDDRLVDTVLESLPDE